MRGFDPKSVVDVRNPLEFFELDLRVNSLEVELVDLSEALGKGACIILLKCTEGPYGIHLLREAGKLGEVKLLCELLS